MNTNLTQEEKTRLVVILEDKIKEWTQLVHNFPGLSDIFNVQDLVTIKNKLENGGN
jgi:hypothetical protein